jgi:hypothetical protein
MRLPQHIAALLEDYLDGKLDPQGQEAVTAWLRESDTNGEALASWFMTEVNLLEASRLADMRSVFEGLTFDARTNPVEPQPSQPVPRVLAPSRQLLVAASVLAVLAAVYWLKPAAKENSASPSTFVGAPKGKDQAPSPAMLGRLADCVWESGMKPIRVGQDISAGTLIDIKSGLVQLVFESGAEIVLKGPCRLRVESSMLCRLLTGRRASLSVGHRRK